MCADGVCANGECADGEEGREPAREQTVESASELAGRRRAVLAEMRVRSGLDLRVLGVGVHEPADLDPTPIAPPIAPPIALAGRVGAAEGETGREYGGRGEPMRETRLGTRLGNRLCTRLGSADLLGGSERDGRRTPFGMPVRLERLGASSASRRPAVSSGRCLAERRHGSDSIAVGRLGGRSGGRSGGRPGGRSGV